MRWWWTLALVGCDVAPDEEALGPAGPTEACAADDLAVTLGTGATSFQALSEDDPVVIVFGPQGGWHVEVAGMVANTGQEVAILPTLTLVDTGEQIAGDQQDTLTALASYDDPTCSGEFFGIRAFVDDAQPAGMSYQQFICGLEGRTLELSVEVEDFTTGDVVQDSIFVVAALDAAGEAACP